MKPRAMNLGGVVQPPALVGVMVLLDRSGSMATIRDAMESAWATFVTSQKALSLDGMWVTLHQFDGGGYDVTYDRTPLAQVGALGLKPRGSTPLRRSMARFLEEARKVVDDPADPTERLLLVVVTDGGETEHPLHPSWAELRETVRGIESADCELIWMGTSAALLEAVDAMPTFAVAGASLGFTANEAGAVYAAGGLSVATMGLRTGTSARATMDCYVKSSETVAGADNAYRDQKKGKGK